jgi:peptidoglycan/xylan/chitin deacetylase (PgdA/CDA1 family)
MDNPRPNFVSVRRKQAKNVASHHASGHCTEWQQLGRDCRQSHLAVGNGIMTLITRATKEFASYLLPGSRYTARLKANPHFENKCSVYLTFDDGPHPENTPRILDQLRQLNAKATFFVLGRKAEKYPELVRRTLNEGHSIGTHSWSHLSAKELPCRVWTEDVVRARRFVEDIAGCAVELFRPPYGELTPRALFSLLRSDVVVVHWSQDPKDFEMDTEMQLPCWFTANRPLPGSIVLLHDSLDLTGRTLGEACSQWQGEAVFKAIPMSR